jgi:hypothetical protein
VIARADAGDAGGDSEADVTTGVGSSELSVRDAIITTVITRALSL